MKNNEENHLMYFIAFIPCFQPKDISADKAESFKWISHSIQGWNL